MASTEDLSVDASISVNGNSEISRVNESEAGTSANLSAKSELEVKPEIKSSQSSDCQQHDGPPKRFLESLYGVEARTEQPVKKVKVDHMGEINGKTNQSFQHKGSGVIGAYINEKTGDDLKPPTDNGVVDLTNEDDDDIQVISSHSRSDEIVCLGKLLITLEVYLCPKPKKKAQYISDQQWPIIHVTWLRKPENKNNYVIDVLDPFDTEFAKVHPDHAHVFAKSMASFENFRIGQSFVTPRHKKPDDWPHRPCSYTIRMQANFYCRRGDVERIGRYYGQNNMFFGPPNMSDKGVEIVNPHKQHKTPLQRKLGGSSSHGQMLSDTRTNEEVAEHMANMIDEWAKKQEKELPETEAPDTILTELLPHQKQALSFMLGRESMRTYDEENETLSLSLWRKKTLNHGTVYEDIVSGVKVNVEPDQVFGGLLADVMGLGKTLEALALVAKTASAAEEFGKERPSRHDPRQADIKSHAKGTLIVCPTSTVQNWDNQIKEHLDTNKVTYYIYHGQKRTTNVFDLKKYDVVITTYGTVSSDAKTKPSILEQLKWFRIVLDEAHTIREPKAQQSIACYSLHAQRRWCLTGTPIQNRLADLNSLTKFLQLYPYDEVSYFNQYIGGKTLVQDPSYLDKLRLFVDSFCLRRTREKIDLPDRKDLVSRLQFSEAERRMHDYFKEKAKVRIDEIIDSKSKKSGVHLHMLKGITTLRLVCAHGRDLLKEKDLKELQGMTAADAINLDEDAEVRTITKREAYENFNLMAEADQDFCHACDTKLTGESPQANGIDDSGSRCYVLPCMDTLCSSCFSNEKELFDSAEDGMPMECPFCGLDIAPQYVPIDTSVTDMLNLPEDTPEETEENKLTKYTGPKTKAKALMVDIAQIKQESKVLEEQGEKPLKCVVFSEFTSNLSLIERVLIANGYTFVRIDGSMSLPARRKVLDAFDNDDDVTILLASIKAAGQGLNLTAASRAFIMEPMWNPAAEAQAVDRIYRIGQKRDVVIKRYIIEESIEGKIVELARKKTMLASAAMGGGDQKRLTKKEQRMQNLKDMQSLFK